MLRAAHPLTCCCPPQLLQGAEPWWKLHELFDEVGARGQVVSSMQRPASKRRQPR